MISHSLLFIFLYYIFELLLIVRKLLLIWNNRRNFENHMNCLNFDFSNWNMMSSRAGILLTLCLYESCIYIQRSINSSNKLLSKIKSFAIYLWHLMNETCVNCFNNSSFIQKHKSLTSNHFSIINRWSFLDLRNFIQQNQSVERHFSSSSI